MVDHALLVLTLVLAAASCFIILQVRLRPRVRPVASTAIISKPHQQVGVLRQPLVALQPGLRAMTHTAHGRAAQIRLQLLLWPQQLVLAMPTL